MQSGKFTTPLVAGLMSLLIAGCGTLPQVTDKPVSRALPQPTSGPLSEISQQLASKRSDGESSVLLLEANAEALLWRMAFIDSARSSIDIQLYLWHGGASGSLLLNRLLEAADRGVRVRLLVDDFLFTGSEKRVAALSRYHPYFEIRVFNPKRYRGNKVSEGASFLTKYKKLNRRMHNKTWTVDRCMSIVGGRNVADHYFGLDEAYNFVDLDVLASGPVVAQISDGFDEFWNASGAHPGEFMSRRGKPEDVAKLRRLLAEDLVDRQEALESFPTSRRDWSDHLASLTNTMAGGRVQFLQDAPELEDDERYVVSTLRALSDDLEREIIYLSPYLIPSKQGLENLARYSERGIQVGILVPTLAANNQALVHGHYKKFRKALIEAGAVLYEMRPDLSADMLESVDVPPIQTDRTCLHGKAVVSDRQKCFIGSLNLDPRAMVINTECGLLIDSEELTGELMNFLKELAQPENAWRVTLDERGRLTWTSGNEVRKKQPKASFGARMQSTISGVLPIRGQL